MAEYVPTRYRTTVLGTLQAGWTVGYIVATLLAGWIIPDHGWRMLFYVAIIPIAIAIFMHILVPEPEARQQSRLNKAINNHHQKKSQPLNLFSKINVTAICLYSGHLLPASFSLATMA